ncbi:metallophosphoesterase [Dehalobacter sp. DCM]|uniref:metallophosphoesterase family protein n=1 Tax=Dehalobacter sp. DCM TaxID=2907827 RepID=UPI003081E2BC|nr:metallophosphoesterase [Dehalobacter sp. DCM]
MAEFVRFVHCGGFRFDCPEWEGPSSWKAMRDKDLWDTFEAVLLLCQTEKADFLLITGDLFDQEYTRKETVERVARAFARLQGIQVFITPGEQDPLVISSVYRYAEWPENVHIFGEGIRCIEISDKQCILCGAGWTTYQQEKYVIDDLRIKDEPVAQAAPIRIMLLHTEIESDSHTENFIPLPPEQIAASTMTYLALGHRNQYTGVHQTGNTIWADCGTAEPRYFHETGPHGVILGQTDGAAVHCEFRELSRRCYSEKVVTNVSGERETDIKNTVRELLTNITADERQRDLFRFRLLGSRWNPQMIDAVNDILKKELRHVELMADGASANEVSEAQDKVLKIEGIDRQKTLGFPSLNHVFRSEIELRIANAKDAEERRHWELVKRIGSAAVSQAISQEQETYED